MASRKTPARSAIEIAIERLQRYGQSVTPEKVWANIHIGDLTMDDAMEGLSRHIRAQIPVVLKEKGFVISDASTRERKSFWDSTPDELEEQARIKREGNRFDQNRIACDEAIISFLREQQKTFGYEVYPGLFHSEIDRIYAMHHLTPPGAKTEEREAA